MSTFVYSGVYIEVERVSHDNRMVVKGCTACDVEQRHGKFCLDCGTILGTVTKFGDIMLDYNRQVSLGMIPENLARRFIAVDCGVAGRECLIPAGYAISVNHPTTINMTGLSVSVEDNNFHIMYREFINITKGLFPWHETRYGLLIFDVT